GHPLSGPRSALARLRAHVTIRAQQRELTALNRRLNREVEQRTQTTIALAESEERLNEAQSLADMGSWQWDTATDETVWSQNMYRLLGYKPGEVPASIDGFRKHVHPDDLNKVSTAIYSCIHKKNPFQVEYRFFRVDGQERYARAVGEVACGIDARPVHIHGTFQSKSIGRKS
ncbi:MAG: PAS domain-containing protein, partial [Thermodesulfobacteriota bacterium]